MRHTLNLDRVVSPDIAGLRAAFEEALRIARLMDVNVRFVFILDEHDGRYRHGQEIGPIEVDVGPDDDIPDEQDFKLAYYRNLPSYDN